MNIYYIYLFRIKKNGMIIYVGSTRTLGARINDHRRSMREIEREQPIHKYLKENNLKLIEDVEIVVIDYADNKKESLSKEMYYFDKYNKTIVNVWKGEEHTGLNHKSTTRNPIKVKDKDIYFYSTREASRKLNKTRYQISNMIKNGELEKIDITDFYINVNTGEKFISGYQLKKRYNIPDRSINKLTKTGYLCINGMEIKKV